MTHTCPESTGARWARFRFSVIGSLLSSPSARGTLQGAIRSLAEKTWSHPVTGRDVHFAAVTIERWYYMARRQHDDPVGALRRAVRKDCGWDRSRIRQRFQSFREQRSASLFPAL